MVKVKPRFTCVFFFDRLRNDALCVLGSAGGWTTPVINCENVSPSEERRRGGLCTLFMTDDTIGSCFNLKCHLTTYRRWSCDMGIGTAMHRSSHDDGTAVDRQG